MNKRRKKRSITLIEIIIVIALISLIGSALAINMRGALDKGRRFKTEQNRSRLESALEMAVAETGDEPTEVVKDWKTYAAKSPFVKGDEVVKDGWGKEFVVSYNTEDRCFTITSEKYDASTPKNAEAQPKKNGAKKK